MRIQETDHVAWAPEFNNPEQYIQVKLKMLRRDMYIRPTAEEIMHLHTLKTRGDIDRAVASIVDRHWS